MRLWIFLGLVSGLSAAPNTAAPDTLVKQYCTGCHNARVKTANLALDGSVSNDNWEKVVRRLRARQMPPRGLPRPTDAVYAATVKELEARLDADARRSPNPGRTAAFRRLTRTEYHNAVRDLLALDIDVSALLPADEASHGFDNVTVGELSPLLLERYLTAARKIGRLAVGLPGKAAASETYQTRPDLTQEFPLEGLPIGTRGGLLIDRQFPVDGEYEIVARLTRDRNEMIEGLYGAHDVEFLIDGERVGLFTVKQPKTNGEHAQADQHLRLRLKLKAGPHAVAVTFPRKTAALVETERQPYPAHFNMDRHPRLQPAVYQVTVNGPFVVDGVSDTPSRRRLFSCRPQTAAAEDSCARQILSGLARHAYRRPVADPDVTPLLRFYAAGRKAGTFEDGIEMGVRAIFVSPEFLFRVEQDPKGVAPGTFYPVSDRELATRLSFFLWSSVPDDELLQLAETGKLRAPGELDKQVRRMLADDRAEALVNNFAAQWLYLRNLDSATPDMRLFPEFDDNLRQAFRRETELFFGGIVRGNRSILDLLAADYTYLNERLARHYGIPGVIGSRFRRVELAGTAHRGGLLRQGSILTVTSYPTRTSPVIRGKWVLDNILGIPPPPPPANVPALKEKAATGKTLTVRERLAEHRANAACAGCHQLMDPVGFALENYDGIGRWRDQEDYTAIDSAGGLPDGSTFSGIDGLEKALRARPELFATTLSEKLLTYALGRGVEPFDAPAVREVVRTAAADDYRFAALITGIVKSVPFQMRSTSRGTPSP